MSAPGEQCPICYQYGDACPERRSARLAAEWAAAHPDALFVLEPAAGRSMGEPK